jgi:hypothetical protein
MTGAEVKAQAMERAPNGRPEVTAERRFWEKVDKRGPDECWRWTGALSSKRYGTLTMGHRDRVPAHRFAYELLVGPIPDGLEIDHLCRNTRCVNPAHMEPVTHRENGLRGTSKAAENARKTHCVRGHSLADAYIYKGGRRQCRTCTLDRQRHRYATDPAYKARKDAHRG